jgi:hypothetical protein
MSESQPKKPWQSGAIITALLGLIFGICEYLGVFVDPELQQVIQSDATIEKITSAEQVKGLATVAISIAFAYFRLRARRAIEGGVDVLKQPFQWVGNLFKRKKKDEA